MAYLLIPWHCLSQYRIFLMLSILSFMEHAFDLMFQKSSPYPKSSRCFAMLYSRRFVVFAFICMLTHFELIFVHVIRSLSSFSVSPHPRLDCSSIICYEDYFLSIAFPLLLCQRSVDCSLFLGLLLYFIDLSLKLFNVGPPTLFFSFMIMLIIPDFLALDLLWSECLCLPQIFVLKPNH